MFSMRKVKHGTVCVPKHEKMFSQKCASSKVLDQPAHQQSLVNLHCPHLEALACWLSTKHAVKTDQTVRLGRLILRYSEPSLQLQHLFPKMLPLK